MYLSIYSEISARCLINYEYYAGHKHPKTWILIILQKYWVIFKNLTKKGY